MRTGRAFELGEILKTHGLTNSFWKAVPVRASLLVPILLEEIESGTTDDSSGDAKSTHPKDTSFHMSAVWNDDGLQITDGKIVITAKDAMGLFRVWVDYVAASVEREAAEHGLEQAYERAVIPGAIRAFHDVFNAVPSAEEMRRGTSILSRKMKLFCAFARDLQLKARKRGIDVKEYLFHAQTHIVVAEDRRVFYRALLHAYVSRVCGVDLDYAEKIENEMRGSPLPPWEEIVEGVYDVSEDMILTVYQQMRDKFPEKPAGHIVDAIEAHFIKSVVLEESLYAWWRRRRMNPSD